MERVWINNRKGEKMIVVVEKSSIPRGVAFIMHGLSGNKDQPHIRTFAQAFKDKNYTVITFDTTNTYGESEGKFEYATTTNYYEDLEDVISWSKKQKWYMKPFVLCGHSLGSISIIHYAQNFPNNVKAIAPISSVISGRLSITTPKYKRIASNWEKSGWREEKSETRPEVVKRLPWSHMEDRLKYDVLPDASKLTMPVLLIVGSEDDGTPYEHQKLLFDRLPGKKQIEIIDNAPHTFIEVKHLNEIKEILETWLVDIENS